MHVDYVYTATMRENVFSGGTLTDLFRGNFCPVHSYIFEKSVIDKWNFRFDPSLRWEEDYDFLLQVASKECSSFDLIGKSIGDYCIKSDKSNSIGIEGTIGTMSEEKQEAYETVKARIELRRQTTYVSDAVQRQLNLLEIDSRLTIRQYLDRADAELK